MYSDQLNRPDYYSILEIPTSTKVNTIVGSIRTVFNAYEAHQHTGNADGTPVYKLGDQLSTQTDTRFFVHGVNQKLGIGTDTPDKQLELEGAAPHIRLRGTQAGALATPYLEYYSSSGRLGWIGYGSPSNNKLYIINEQADSMCLLTSDTERITILADGKVGLNETNPVVPLAIKYSVTGPMIVCYNTSAADTVIDFNVNGTNKGNVGWSQTYNAFLLNSHGVNTVVNPDGGGVGIATSSIDANTKLDVYGGVRLYAGSSGNSPKLYFGSETDDGAKCIFQESWWINYQAHRDQGHYFYGVNISGTRQDLLKISGDAYTPAANQALFYSAGGGGVAINSSSTNSKALYVNGSSDLHGTTYCSSGDLVMYGGHIVLYSGYNIRTASRSAALVIENSGGSGSAGELHLKTSSSSYGKIKFKAGAGSTESVIIDNLGKVGIGTNPSYTLDVNGDCRITGNMYLPSLPSYDIYDDIEEIRKMDFDKQVNIKDLIGFMVGGLKQIEKRIRKIEERVGL